MKSTFLLKKLKGGAFLNYAFTIIGIFAIILIIIIIHKKLNENNNKLNKTEKFDNQSLSELKTKSNEYYQKIKQIGINLIQPLIVSS
jgi:putative exporter of polyketide antibiotics